MGLFLLFEHAKVLLLDVPFWRLEGRRKDE